MRRAAILLLAAASAVWAQGPVEPADPGEPLSPAELKHIDWLVGKLSARDSFLRSAAQRELAGYGRRVVPVLRAYDPDDAEARVRIQSVLRQLESIELTARFVTSAHAVGAPVAIRMRLINHTRQSHVIPIQQGALTPFRISIAGDGRFLKRSEVTFTPQQTHEIVTIKPEHSIVAEVAIDASELPRGKRGAIPIVVSYTSQHVLRVVADAAPSESTVIEGDAITLVLVAPELAVDVRTRTIAELEAALDVSAERQRALVEIRFRDDDEIVPLLRRHSRDTDLRLHAVRTLGAKGDPEDLETIRRATKDPAAAVRKAATLALGNFDDERARRKLRGLTNDAELRLEAVKALTKHRQARTIDTFVVMLRKRFHEGEWDAEVRKALLEWTGKTIPNTPSEVAAFERWWRANRADWVRRNAQR